MQSDPSRVLAEFAAKLRYEDIPPGVIAKSEDLFLDWFASALAGKSSPPVEAIARFARSMGPPEGPCEILIHRKGTSPLAATLANAASSHVAEQDDVHNGSVFHPATVVFPPALAVAQASGSSGRDFLTACIAGYEAGIRIGEFLGRSHYKIFHTTGTAGTIAAAVATGKLLGLGPEKMLHAVGSAGTQAAGLWEFLRDAADSKQLHAGHAAAAGLTAAYLAADGFTGARRILEGAQGMAAGMSRDADQSRLTDRLGSRWALSETSFKFHASCRHTHPAADALLQIVRDHSLAVDDIESVTAHVHQGAIDVLGPVREPQTVHQAKFSMGTVLGLIALHGRAGLGEFDSYFNDPVIRSFERRVHMLLDEEVDAAYPAQWIGKVTVRTVAGKRHQCRVMEPRGDPGNSLTRTEIEEKALRLAHYRNAASETEMRIVFERAWNLHRTERVERFLV
jgi:2-methylcitrate dehydratase PrpD